MLIRINSKHRPRWGNCLQVSRMMEEISENVLSCLKGFYGNVFGYFGFLIDARKLCYGGRLPWATSKGMYNEFVYSIETWVCCVAIVDKISEIGMSKLTFSVNNWKIGWRLFFLPVNYPFESQNKLTNYVTKTSQTFNGPLLRLSSISCWLPIAVGSSHQSMKSLFRKLEKSDAEIEITSTHTHSE